MIFFIAPSGGNNSYICLKLIGTNIDGMTTYHAKGTHSDEKQIINFMHYETKTEHTQVVITEDYNKVKNLIKDNDTVIRNNIDKHRELLLLNWFHKNIEQLGPELELQYGWKDSWIKWQTDLWKNNSKIPIASAVAEWMYKLYDDTFPEIKNISEIKKVFNWSVMYESPQATVDEFKKIGYNYTVEEHDKWLASQSKIIGYWEDIKNNIDTPLALEDDVHKGLALALHGRMYDLNRSQVESKFKLLP